MAVFSDKTYKMNSQSQLSISLNEMNRIDNNFFLNSGCFRVE